jgi:phenylacetate-CoA ligase
MFTINRLENVSPRIRYNIHDRGIVRSMKSVRDVLSDRRVSIPEIEPTLDLPLVFHWGRQGNAVGFYGCKITPEDIQHVILRVPALASKVANFALHPFEDAEANKRLELWLELENEVVMPESTTDLDAAVWRELAAVNQDFRESVKMIPAGRAPTIKLFAFGQSPMSGQDIRVKKQYIV